MSFLQWLDTSERDRRKMLDVIDLFSQKETVDELGVGSIRDTVADWLAPGTSTIQTRARYFFFIPWMYLDLERRRTPAESVAKTARAFEVKLSPVLAKSKDGRGTIGKQAGAALKRLPSAVYWSGLKQLGFRLFAGSQDRYHRLFGALARDARRDDANDLAETEHLSGNWNPHIPRPPADFPDHASLALTRSEAEFFAERLELHARGSLLHFLVESRDPGTDARLPWEHTQVAKMPAPLSIWMHDARCYSELMHGAALLYNLMLAELRGKDEWRQLYREQFEEWALKIDASRDSLASWDRRQYWSRMQQFNPRLPFPAQAFSERWIGVVLASASAAKLASSSTGRKLIEERERQIKGHRARLHSPAHLELWGGASSSSQLVYRWGITSTLASDIVTGLGA